MYSLGFSISGTHPDPTLPVLARIPHFRLSPGSYLFWYSPGFLPSLYSPGSHITDTRPDSPFSVLAQILSFPILTRNSTFPVLSRIPPFRYSPGFPHFRYSLGSYLFRYSPGFLPSQYSPGSHLFGTHLDFTFSGACPDLSPEFARISSSSPASPPDFIIFSSIVPGSLIFPGIVHGFL